MPDQIIREIPLIQRYARNNEDQDFNFCTFLKVRLDLSNEKLDAIVRETTDAENALVGRDDRVGGIRDIESNGSVIGVDHHFDRIANVIVAIGHGLGVGEPVACRVSIL